jgi:hypothetical protein
LLVVAAAAASAALAHVVIDVIADYLVPHASFDDVSSHGSRELIVSIAVAAAGMIALRGFRLCCEAAELRGVRAPDPPRWSFGIVFVLATVAFASLAVPAMEWIDTLLAGQQLAGLDDAFGGSVTLGLITVAVCAGTVALATFAFVRWLLSHRDRIIAAIVAIICKIYAAPPSAAKLRTFATVPIRRRSIASMRRGKRGPPRFAVSSSQLTQTAHEDLHATRARCGVLSRYRQRSYAGRGGSRPGFSAFLRSQIASHPERREGDLYRIVASRPLRPHGECDRLRNRNR